MSKKPPHEQQPNALSDEQLEAMVHAAMWHKGKLLPITDSLTRTPFSNHLMPDYLKNPHSVLEKGQAKLKSREQALENKGTLFPAGPVIHQELGRVARDGCAGGIPEDVELIMEKAREKTTTSATEQLGAPSSVRTITASQSRLNDIAELAEAVVDDFIPKGEKIDPFLIASKLGIQILPDDYKGAFDGLLEYRDGKFLIYYDSARLGGSNKPRVRFTIAHELGHYFIDEHREALRAGMAPPHGSQTNYTSSNPVEREADTFAANLLLPNSRFLGIAKSVRPNLELILPIARQFGTSWTSTVLRYVLLDLHPCAIAIVRSDAIAWTWVSPSLAKVTYPSMIRTVGKIPDGSTRRILSCPTNFSDGRVERNATTAAFWFLYATGNRDELLTEEAVSLQDFGVLTFLSLMDKF